MATCYRHPNRETAVSCSNCGRPICPDCMTTSPVGMRCPECARQTTKARTVKVKLNRKVLYELDGGDRTKVKAFKVKVEAGAITVCVPGSEEPNA